MESNQCESDMSDYELVDEHATSARNDSIQRPGTDVDICDNVKDPSRRMTNDGRDVHVHVRGIVCDPNAYGIKADYVNGCQTPPELQHYEYVVGSEAGHGELVSPASHTGTQHTDNYTSLTSVPLGGATYQTCSNHRGQPSSPHPPGEDTTDGYTGVDGGTIRGGASPRYTCEAVADGGQTIHVRVYGTLPSGWVPGKNDADFGITFLEHRKYKPEKMYNFFVHLQNSVATRKMFDEDNTSGCRCTCTII